MRKLFLICVGLISSYHVFCQNEYDDNFKKSSVYFELCGNAGYLYNISYDRIVYQLDKNKISLAFGGQFLPDQSGDDNILSISPQLIYFRGQIHHIELGIGTYYDFLNSDFAIIPRFGYRYQKSEGGILFKAAITPMITDNAPPIFGEGWKFLPFAGVAVGYSF